MIVNTKWTPTGAAARGAAFFDEHEPGWFNRIDVARLDINRCDLCIGGQLYGKEYDCGVGYRHAVQLVGIDHTRDFGIAGYFDELPALTAAWREEIARRRLATVRMESQREAVGAGVR